MGTKYKIKYKLVVSGVLSQERTYYYRNKANAKQAEKTWRSNHPKIKTVLSEIYDNRIYDYMD